MSEHRIMGGRQGGKTAETVDALQLRLTALQSRVAELEAALQREVDNCVNCEGKGRYITHREGGYEFTVTCERCQQSRELLKEPK